ncbi:MAG: radical SAM protein [Deltaproteobacteria bacterium]|nr:radical SAM protein [Deltaproteobacteria bacterium]
MMSFGPVPSRRLGCSLGVNNIPPKACTYSCVYCQLGTTKAQQGKRRSFFEPREILNAVRSRLERTLNTVDKIDYISFVPDGEPSLDINLGHEIDLLKTFGIKIAVISNTSLIWRDDVKEDLLKADWVSFKIDSLKDEIWNKINRPHDSFQMQPILDGLVDFADAYKGILTVETMLINEINDREDDIREVGNYLTRLKPDKTYLSIPTRPPAEDWVSASKEKVINRSYQILNDMNVNVEYLIGYEGNEFAFTGDVKEGLLSITSVHPMRSDAVNEYLSKANSDWRVIDSLIREGELVQVTYNDNIFYMRRLNKNICDAHPEF